MKITKRNWNDLMVLVNDLDAHGAQLVQRVNELERVNGNLRNAYKALCRQVEGKAAVPQKGATTYFGSMPSLAQTGDCWIDTLDENVPRIKHSDGSWVKLGEVQFFYQATEGHEPDRPWNNGVWVDHWPDEFGEKKPALWRKTVGGGKVKIDLIGTWGREVGK